MTILLRGQKVFIQILKDKVQFTESGENDRFWAEKTKENLEIWFTIRI